MTKLLTILTSRSAWLAFFMALVLSFLLVSITHAQTPEEIASKYGVTFPVSELGNCDSLASCRTYCEDPLNHNTCIDYAKAKGFHKEEPTQTNKDAILAAAKTDLGCDSESACMALCNQTANFDKCSSFAQKHGLGGGHVQNPNEEKYLGQAKQVLGCDSPTSCMNFCNDEANKQKCSEFAKQTGLRGGEHQVGPGGCTSQDSCKALCSDPNNYKICSGFSAGTGGQFSGPGGCNSEESCKAYCEQNPQACSSLGGPGGSPPPGYNPEEMCNRTPECAWKNNSCQCGSYEGSGPSGGTYDPAKECTKYSGCSWTGSSCQCSGSGETQPSYSPYPQPTSGTYTPPSGGSYDPATYSTPSPTESSPGTTTQSVTSTPPPTESTTTTSSPAPSGVQGITTGSGLFQLLLDWLR